MVEPKYKIGDRVVVKSCSSNILHHNFSIGDVVVINSVDTIPNPSGGDLITYDCRDSSREDFSQVVLEQDLKMEVYNKTKEEKYKDRLLLYYHKFVEGYLKILGDIEGYNNGVFLRAVYDDTFGIPYDQIYDKARLAKKQEKSFLSSMTNKELRAVCYTMAKFVNDPNRFYTVLLEGQRKRDSKLRYSEKIIDGVRNRLYVIKQKKENNERISNTESIE